jgi:oligopeptide/dipeptide ABC transporter ATP-binding protein
LDLSVQAQVLNLLHDLQNDLELAYLFIAHDLDVVRHLSHRIIVLYRGRIMEYGDAATIYGEPAHPYTRALLAASPVPDPDRQRERRRARSTIDGDPVGPDACPFAPRCPHVVQLCRATQPALETTPSGAVVACHRWRELNDTPLASSRAGGQLP